jgi:hypothetical protein
VLTRRAFVGGLLAAVALGRAPFAAARPVFRLAGRRERAFRSLVAVLRGAPDRRWRVTEPARAAQAFARWYAAQPAAGRAHADAVLDLVAARGGARAALAADEGAVRAAAIGLVCVVCEPPPAPDERPVIPAMTHAA